MSLDDNTPEGVGKADSSRLVLPPHIQWGRPSTWSDPIAWRAAAREFASKQRWRWECDQLAKAEAERVVSLSQAEFVDERRQMALGDLLASLPAVGRAAEQSTDAGAETSITAPASSQGRIVGGGIDWLELCLHLVWNPKLFKALRERLAWAKRESQNGRLGYLPDPSSEREIVVHPDGRRHGPPGAGVFCDWCLQLMPGVTLHLASVPDHTANGGRANAFVRITGIACLMPGALPAWRVCKRLLLELGACIDKTVVSRLDGCVDLVGVHVREFVRAFVEGRCVKRARHWQINGNGVPENSTGLTIGKGTRLVAYDKIAECEGDDEKFQLMTQVRWGGLIPQVATRVEFHLHNDELRENYGICSMEDVETPGKLGALFDGLVTEWCRFTETVPDRAGKHQWRAVASSLWREVAEVFASVFKSRGEVLAKPVKVVPNVKRLRDSMAGFISSSIAATIGSGKSLKEAKQVLQEKLGTFEDFMVWLMDFASSSYGVVLERSQEKLVEFHCKRVSNSPETMCVPVPFS